MIVLPWLPHILAGGGSVHVYGHYSGSCRCFETHPPQNAGEIARAKHATTVHLCACQDGSVSDPVLLF